MKSFLVKSVAVSLLTSTASAQPVYKDQLGCGACIKGGWNFCFKGTDAQVVEDTEPQKKCCEDATEAKCPEVVDPSWSCSSSYADQDYALTFCPFKKKKCGDTAEVTFGESDVNKTQEIKVANLAAGESCSFKIKAQCNSPAFQAL